MYTITIGVPFRRRNERQCEVASDWARSLLLLRDSLEGKFGELLVAAPELPQSDDNISQQKAHLVDSRNDGIQFHSLGQKNWRTRHFWPNYHALRKTLNHLALNSQIVHGGINNLSQPYALMGFNAAVRNNVTSVFVLDGDAVQRSQDLLRHSKSPLSHLRNSFNNSLYSRVARKAVSRATLALLKGQSLHQRYGRFAANAKDFVDTSYSASDIVPQSVIQEKIRQIKQGCPIRCIYLGRLIDYKGVDFAINAVAQVAQRKIPISLDIIGNGPAEQSLRNLVSQLRAENVVRFLGHRPYGSALLQETAAYHIMMFTSVAEETPRALFDGLAVGCALSAFDIPFAQQVVADCNHGRAVPCGNIPALAQSLIDAHNDRNLLSQWITAAAAAAPRHAAEVWYRRRAEWTFQAYDKQQAKLRQPIQVPMQSTSPRSPSPVK